MRPIRVEVIASTTMSAMSMPDITQSSAWPSSSGKKPAVPTADFQHRASAGLILKTR